MTPTKKAIMKERIKRAEEAHKVTLAKYGHLIKKQQQKD